jgi:hypothetical protein
VFDWWGDRWKLKVWKKVGVYEGVTTRGLENATGGLKKIRRVL